MSDIKNILYKDHAILRMLERGISKNEVLEVIQKGEIIELYNDDYPYPSHLMFKMIGAKPLHVVVAYNKDEVQQIIVTVYIPDSTTFANDFKTRK